MANWYVWFLCGTNEFHDCCCSVLPGLIRLFWQHYMCYDVIKTMSFVIMGASFVLFDVQISLFW